MVDVQELDKAVKAQWDDDPESWEKQDQFFRELSSTGSKYSKFTSLDVGDYTLRLVDSEGGPSDGGGNNYWNFIFTVDGSDQLFEIDTDFDSYEGNSWYGSVYECEPYIVEVTKYRKKKQ